MWIKSILSKIQQKIMNDDRIRKEYISIKVKLIICNIAIAVIPIILIASFLFSEAKTSLLEKVDNSNAAYISKSVEIMNIKMKYIEDTSKMIFADQNIVDVLKKTAADYENNYFMNQERKESLGNMITTISNSNSDIMNIFVVKDTEVIDSQAKYSTPEFLNTFLKSEEYQRVLDASSKPVWFSDLFGTEDIFLMRLFKGVGVLVIEVKKDYLATDLKSTDISNNAILSLISQDGQIVTSGKDAKNNVADGTIKKIISVSGQEIEKGSTVKNAFTIDVNSQSNSVIYNECNNGWYYVLQVPTKVYLSDINKIKTASITITLIIALIAIAIGIWVAFSISGPINYIRNKLKKVEQGDLTVESNYQGKYELGQLSGSFNEMVGHIRMLLGGVEKVVQTTSDNSEKLKQIASGSALASKEVMQALESVTTGAAEQAKDAERTSGIIQNLVHHISNTKQHFSTMMNTTNETKKASTDAKSTINDLNITTKDTIELSKDIQKDIMNLAINLKEISGITDIINNISQQTNLLSLNAAIEAARAGESGRGFAVVAGEVGKLAIQSSNAANNIDKIIKSINSSTKNTVEMIEAGANIYKKQENAVKNTEQIFKQIVINMDEILMAVGSANGMFEDLQSIQSEATDSITSIAAIAEETAASIEEVLASSQEQIATTEDLVGISFTLSEVINDMRHQINKFKM